MKALVLLVACFIAFSCSNKHLEVINDVQDYSIIPKPHLIEKHNGRFLINVKTKINADESLKTEGLYLADMLSAAIGKQISISSTDGIGNILLKTNSKIENEEGYTLEIKNNQVIITGKNSKGVFLGIQSLRQLLPASIELKLGDFKKLSVPCVYIEDAPRYSYRGMHLDVGRHMFSVDFIKKYIDLIAMHKMNTFHWHLTEDQGWRIEIKKYPKLTEIGSKRYGTIIGHHKSSSVKTNDEIEYGGFYTQKEIKEIVAYATERHITVIPEIELPGHSSAAIAAYPSLSCFPEESTIVKNSVMSKKGNEIQASGTPKIVQETWGIFKDVYCAGKDETFTFIEDVLEEVIPLFPSEYIHIGGDECPKTNWEKCLNCQARIKKEGLRDEHELQSYFIQRIEKYLNSKGKKIIGWDEILEGGLAPNATVMSWRGIKGGIDAAMQHHDVVMTPGDFCYFDHYQSDNKANEPLAFGGMTSIADVYAYEPTPEELTIEEQKFILGAQGNVWTEYISTTDYLEYMILPRMTALSEVVWSSKDSKNWPDFKFRLTKMKDRYDAMKLNYAKHIFTKN